jgi:hypothetical protein
MRLSFALVLSLFVLISSTQAFFIPQEATRTVMKSRSQLPQGAETLLFGSAPRQRTENTSSIPVLSKANSSLAIGFFGQSGLLLLSILLVTFVTTVFFPSPEGERPAGILNRCPWPFVVFHDPKQFLKDSPTWMCVTWVALWRITKIVAARKV